MSVAFADAASSGGESEDDAWEGGTTAGAAGDRNVTQQDLLEGESIDILQAKSKKRITISLANQHQVVCPVCGCTGHSAGFRGAVYALLSSSWRPVAGAGGVWLR